MDIIEKLKKELEKNGWKNLDSGSYGDIDFDLIGFRKFFFITKWNIFIKKIKCLDEKEKEKWENVFEKINNDSTGLVWGKCFILCLIIEKVSDNISNLTKDSFGLFGMIRAHAGGGNIFVVDMKNRKIYGKVPPLPYDAHKYSKGIKNILEKLFT